MSLLLKMIPCAVDLDIDRGYELMMVVKDIVRGFEVLFARSYILLFGSPLPFTN